MPRPSRLILVPAFLLSAAVLAGGVFGVWRAIGEGMWFRLGFEVVLVVAGLIGVFAGLGRFRSAPAWALMSVGGTVVVAAFMANLSGGTGQGASFNLSGFFQRYAQDPISAGQLGAGALILTLSVLVLVTRSPRVSFTRLGIGLALLAPVVVGAALWFTGPLRTWVHGLHPIVQAFFGLVAFIGILVLVSVGGNLVIRSLEAGGEADRQGRRVKAATPKPE